MDYVEDLKAGGGGRNSSSTTTTGSTSSSVELDLPMAPTAPILTDSTSTRPARSPSSAGGGGAAASSGSTPGAVTPPRPPPTGQQPGSQAVRLQVTHQVGYFGPL